MSDKALWMARLERVTDENLIHLSEFMVIVLIGVAYEATIEPIGESLRTGKDTGGTLILLGAFVMTTFRFLVGNYRHLNHEATKKSPRYILLYDMFWIGLESIAMIYLGSFMSIDRNQKALESAGNPFNYLSLLLMISGIDVLWLLSRTALIRRMRGIEVERAFHWDWLGINAAMVIIGLVALCCYRRALLDTWFLSLMLLVNFVFFLVDVSGFFDRSPLLRSDGDRGESGIPTAK